IVMNSARANCSGSIADGGYNLSDDASCGFGASGSGVGDKVDLRRDPRGLQNNGGSTDTIAMQSGSPAVGAVPLAQCPAFDQRGIRRHAAARVCDAGATESDGIIPSADKPGPIGGNNFGTGPEQFSTVPGTVEPPGTRLPGRMILSIVAIEGVGS